MADIKCAPPVGRALVRGNAQTPAGEALTRAVEGTRSGARGAICHLCVNAAVLRIARVDGAACTETGSRVSGGHRACRCGEGSPGIEVVAILGCAANALPRLAGTREAGHAEMRGARICVEDVRAISRFAEVVRTRVAVFAAYKCSTTQAAINEPVASGARVVIVACVACRCIGGC